MGAHVLAKLREMDRLPEAQEMKLIQGLQVVVLIRTTQHLTRQLLPLDTTFLLYTTPCRCPSPSWAGVLSCTSPMGAVCALRSTSTPARDTMRLCGQRKKVMSP